MSSMLKLSNFIDAIEETIKSWGVKTVEYSPDYANENDIKNIQTPAVLIFCQSTGPLQLESSGGYLEPMDVELVCLIQGTSADDERAALNFQSFIKRKLIKNKWGLGRSVHNPESITSINSTNPLLGYKEWRISFSQSAVLENKEAELHELIGVYLGINPKTDDDYRYIGELNE